MGSPDAVESPTPMSPEPMASAGPMGMPQPMRSPEPTAHGIATGGGVAAARGCGRRGRGLRGDELLFECAPVAGLEMAPPAATMRHAGVAHPALQLGPEMAPPRGRPRPSSRCAIPMSPLCRRHAVARRCDASAASSPPRRAPPSHGDRLWAKLRCRTAHSCRGRSAIEVLVRQRVWGPLALARARRSNMRSS